MKGFKGKLDYRRDPHLPDPVICDWLLEQDWSVPTDVNIEFSNGETDSSMLSNFLHASIGVGADYIIEVLIPNELIEFLRGDARARQAIQALEELAE